MGDDDVVGEAYVLDDEGNRHTIDSELPEREAEEQQPAFDHGPGHHPDGSRTWRFVPAADPRSWGDLGYIDQHIDEVKNLGWIEDNPEGYHWTVDEAVQTYEAWAESATAAYRTVDYGDGQSETSAYVPVAERAPQEPFEPAAWTAAAYEQGGPAEAGQGGAVPAAPPAPPGPEWGRPLDRSEQGTGYHDVMDELRARVPENDGRWTATEAAQVYGDTQFMDEQGITAAQGRMSSAAGGMVAPDGTVSAQGYLDVTDASADADRARIQADTSRNRYQQSTDFQPEVSAEQQQRWVDESQQSTRDQVANDPQSLGIGMTDQQRTDYAEVQEYMARTGQQLDPAVPLNAEQRAYLEQTRAVDQAEAARQQADYEASPGYREDQAANERRAQFAQTEAERVEASRVRAEERMQTPTSERIN
jgi:hypothetical protein